MRFLRGIVALLLIIPVTVPGSAEKLSPELRQGPAGKKRVIVVRQEKERPAGLAFRRAEVTAVEARKLAAATEVVAVLPDKPVEVPPIPGPHLRWDQLFQSTQAYEPIAPDMWLAKDVHGAPIAWANGYTGVGVKVAVIDEGIDFGHPDLEGTQARVTDPNSPYYGWPIAFDPAAMASYAATGRPGGSYVNTSATVTGPTAVFRTRTFTLTGTSKSGVYHIGEHNGYWLRFSVGKWGIPPAVLVVDEEVPGVYDTVYVDINKDYDFRNDKPCRRGDEAAWVDLTGDGLADYSAGMIYFIADGKNPVPASDWLYNLPPPDNGSMVAFAGAYGKSESHGTLVASAVVAQGRSGSRYSTPQKPPDSGGMVYGTAPGAGIIQIGNIYASQADLYDALLFCALGYDGIPRTGDEADIVNMSFSVSAADDDGWDFLSRYITHLNATIAPRTTFVGAIGNGGPGYGTVSSPGGASSVVTVGAATLFGSTPALDPIRSIDQILFGDVQQWSNRGPNSLGQVKPDVVSVGAWATGSVPLSGSGENAWAVWAGTSLAAPVASGILALIYEAYGSNHGVYPDHLEARAILMSGARDICYNVFEQGAGFADAARSTDIASERGGLIVRPSSWSAGKDKHSAPAFPNVLKPGQSSMKDFTIENRGDSAARVSVSGRRLLQTGGSSFTVETSDSKEELEAMTHRPDYLIDLSNSVPQDTDLLRIRVSLPYAKFSLSDPASRGLDPASLWMVSLFDWTDLNRDGILWSDLDGNGVVNKGEWQDRETNRFMYGLPWANVIEVSVRRPMERIHDGLFLGLHHALKGSAIPTTQIKVQLEFYRQVKWDWINVPARPLSIATGGKARILVKLQAPNNAPPGIYAGSVVIAGDSGECVVPVSAVVTVKGNFSSPDPLIINGSDGSWDTFDNGNMFCSFDWGWREESGDWRFYFLDLNDKRPKMSSYLLANATWPDMPADTDILLYRPDRTDYFSNIMPEVFGPYGLALSGASRNMYTNGGKWSFETATGGSSEWVVGEASPGLNLIQLHNVLQPGDGASRSFSLKAGQIWLEPGNLDLRPGQTSAEIRCISSMALPGLSGLAFGLSLPQVITRQPIQQGVVQEPWLARWTRDIVVDRAGLIEIQLSSTDPAIDIDLYLLHDANDDGEFDWDMELIALSGTPGANEHIRLQLPKDGRYRIAVHGYKVPSPSFFDISILVVDGEDMELSLPTGQIKHNKPETIRLSFPPAPAGSVGMLFLGPREAPGVLAVPAKVGS